MVALIALIAAGLLGATASAPLAKAGTQATTAGCEPGADRGLYRAISELNATARNRWPDTFGELWILAGNPHDGVFVGFSEDAATKVAELAEEFVCPELLRAVDLNYSSNEISRFQNRLTRDRERAGKGLAPLGHATNGDWASSADVRFAEIEVFIPLVTRRIQAAFRSEYAANDVRVRVTKTKTNRFRHDGYQGITILLRETGYYGDNPETGKDWGARLKRLNRQLRQNRVRLKRARATGARHQARKLQRQVNAQRRQKQVLRRKMLALPWPIQRPR